MKLNFITIMVRSIEKSLTFYQELVGLQEVRHMSLKQGEIVFLANGKEETKLELIEFKDREKAIMLGGSPSDIIKQGPKPRHFTVEDPDGIIVEFTE